MEQKETGPVVGAGEGIDQQSFPTPHTPQKQAPAAGAAARSIRLTWKGERLFRGGTNAGLSVVPDGKHPGMWRVRYPNGRLSDMVNRARAKDAAEYSYQRYRLHSGGGGPPAAQQNPAPSPPPSQVRDRASP